MQQAETKVSFEKEFSHLNLHDSTRHALQRLYSYAPSPEEHAVLDRLHQYPSQKTAAVLVLLYEHNEILRVLLTTRSMALRSHPGQTAFPGGKCDPQDANVKETALREAHEECGLDPKSPALHYIGQLPPYLSQWKLVVTPVLFFLDDPSVLASLVPCTQEVDRIFTHPLQAILDPELASDEVLSRKGSDDWPYEEELYNTSDSTWTQIRGSLYRMHRFRSAASPIKGLTSDVLIRVAQIAYEAEPTYQRYGPGQPTHTQFVAWALEDLSSDTTTRVEVNGTMESTAYASREVDGAQ